MTEPHKIKLISADIKEIERKVKEYVATKKTGIVRYEINFYKGGITTKKVKHEIIKQGN